MAEANVYASFKKDVAEDPSTRPRLEGMLWSARSNHAVALCYVADALYRIAEAIAERKEPK